MKKEVEKVEMTSSQLFTFSTQTCQWWNAVFIQAKRFMDDLEHNDGGTPWDEKNENNMLVADRMFFITTLHHAIENLQKLISNCKEMMIILFRTYSMLLHLLHL